MSMVPVSGWDALLLTVHFTEGAWHIRAGAGFILCVSYVAYRVVRRLAADA